jgi:hypothetical protein
LIKVFMFADSPEWMDVRDADPALVDRRSQERPDAEGDGSRHAAEGRLSNAGE